jgi:glutamate racemase
MHDVTPTESHVIGVFDSGVGGLSVVREIRRLLPGEEIQYFADQANVPYGPRPQAEVRRFAEAIAHFLLDQGAKLIVVACNTASAAALGDLRRLHPDVPFVGMEPAVKPAARMTHTGAVGVLATQATFQGALFASTLQRFAGDVRVIERTLPGLVERIEAGDLSSSETRRILIKGLAPLRREKVDTLVLACTHYPFVIPLIRELAGPDVQVIDPSPAIARRAAWLIGKEDTPPSYPPAGRLTFYSTADAQRLRAMAEQLIHLSGEALEVRWWRGSAVLASREERTQ